MRQPRNPKQVLLVLAVVGVVYAVNHFFGPFDFLSGGGDAKQEQGGGVATGAPADPPPSKGSDPSRPGGAAQESGGAPGAGTSGDAIIARAFRDKRSDVLVTVEGRVSRILPDDRIGSPHQKFIVTLASGATLLVAHNIDLAPRVPIRRGDTVAMRGEYEWSERGGVLHWTHHDPAKRHPDGWIRHEGKDYK